MQHKRCEGCNIDVILDMSCMTHASQKNENMDQMVVQSSIPHLLEELPTHTHRHLQDIKAGSLDVDSYHRRLSLDEVDSSLFSTTYCDRMSGIELDRMKVSSVVNYLLHS